MKERIAPLEPPFDAATARHLEGLMPRWSKMPPLRLFRIWARHLPLAEALRAVGSHLLARGALEPRDREILILRTCARCGGEYEWGVHAVGFPPRVGLSEEQVRATVDRDAEAECWSERDRWLLRAADELHDGGQLSDAVWSGLAAGWSEAQRLEIVAVVGFYHLVSYTANAVRVEPEPWAGRFAALAGR